MSSDAQSREILGSILGVLQGIEKKLGSYEDRLRSLEDNRDSPAEDSLATLTDAVIARAALPEARLVDPLKSDARILYSEWSTNHILERLPQSKYEEWDTYHRDIDDFLDLRLSKAIETKLGDCWHIPDDDRIPLKFFKHNVFKSNWPWGRPKRTVYQTTQPYERELDFLCRFDSGLRSHPGNDFAVIDFDAQNVSRIYRIGESAVGPDLMVDLDVREEAPWSRIILFQGATTGGSISEKRRNPEQPIPYFVRTDPINGVWNHISYHLRLKPRGTTTNPYTTSPWSGFHTTFYEICATPDPIDNELWKHGPLYDHPLGYQFRKCAYTLYAPLCPKEIGINRRAGEQARFWTILVLSPSGFFEKEKSRAFPLAELGAGESETLGHSFGRLTRLGAEMSLIGHGLERISERWAEFQAYFDYILDSADSLMHPSEHDNLLFDDGTFSRSRKYFWAIDCLGEFDLCISDNLRQWDLYKNAHIPAHLLPQLNRLDTVQYNIVERQRSILENQRESFRQKLAAIKALRDALFNASAVIESRASTRLGEHVKLLTFVSIFFLPLAFTTSLWSVNDKFSMTVLIYVIILVACTTYFVMFNINSLARGFDGVYGARKKRIVGAMKRDRKDKWKLRGKRFEVFRPKAENPEPSEWYIPYYTLLHPRLLLGLLASSGQRSADVSEESGKGWWAFLTRWTARSKQDKKDELSEEPWVM